MPIRVGLIGDSITAGNVAPDRDGGTPYAERLAGLLGAGYEVLNFGFGGTTTAEWLPEGAPVGKCDPVVPCFDLLPLPFDAALILLGNADGLFLPVEPAIYRQNLETITAELLAEGVDSIVLMTPIPNPFPSDRINGVYAMYRSEVLDLCGADGDAIVCGPDLFELFVLEEHFHDPFMGVASDVHPNDAGHALIAAEAYRTLIGIPEPDTGALIVVGLLVCGARRWTPSRRTRPR